VVVETVSGAETRISQWLVARHRGSISLEMRTPAQMAALKAFFLVRTGRARGFRFRDWTDYQVTNEPLIPQPAINPPVGGPTLQLIKTYTDGLLNYVRNIYKPSLSPVVTLRKNGSAFAGYVLDSTTGIVTLTALNTRAITGVLPVSATVVSHAPQPLFMNRPRLLIAGTGRVHWTGGPVALAGVPPVPSLKGWPSLVVTPTTVLIGGAEPFLPRSSSAATAAGPGALVTVGAAHGFVTGDLIYFTGVVGVVPINNLVGTVTATAATTITVSLSTALTGVYTSGGTATKYFTATDTVDFSGTFEVPIRFDTDSADIVAEDIAILNFSSIGIVELIS
jgi:hypothetical protein